MIIEPEGRLQAPRRRAGDTELERSKALRKRAGDT
jgi:hypothetical protein